MLWLVLWLKVRYPLNYETFSPFELLIIGFKFYMSLYYLSSTVTTDTYVLPTIVYIGISCENTIFVWLFLLRYKGVLTRNLFL